MKFYKRRSQRILSIFAAVAVMFACLPYMGGEVFAAAAKKPSAPVITSAKETTTVNDTDWKAVRLKWKKAKYAKEYQLAVRSNQKKWVKIKTVKKSARNKKKYTKNNKFRVKAKGKNYVVYRYQYKYSVVGTTKKCAFRFVETSRYGNELKGNKTYIFAVRSVNGSKHSAWSTAQVKTSVGDEDDTYTTAGQKMTETVNGQTITLEVGKQCTVPILQPKKGTVEARSITFTPSKIHRRYYYVDYKRELEEFEAYGTTPDGSDAYWSISATDGICDSVYYILEDLTFSNADKSKYSFDTNAGYGPNGYRGRTKVQVKDPNVTIVWTLDGAEPKLGQADKSIDASEYPFGQIMVKFAPYSDKVQVRGSSVLGQSSNIWPELTTLFNRCEWIRIYNGSSLVKDDFMWNSYY